MRHRKSNKKQAIPVGKKGREIANLKTETGLAPVPPLGVVAVKKDLLAFLFLAFAFASLSFILNCSVRIDRFRFFFL